MTREAELELWLCEGCGHYHQYQTSNQIIYGWKNQGVWILGPFNKGV